RGARGVPGGSPVRSGRRARSSARRTSRRRVHLRRRAADRGVAAQALREPPGDQHADQPVPARPRRGRARRAAADRARPRRWRAASSARARRRDRDEGLTMLASSSVEALPSQAIGRYELLLELGRGGMAVLYLARAQGVGGFSKLFAIKQILPHLAADPP